MKFERLGEIVKITKGKKHEPAPEKEGRNFRYIQIDDLRNDNNLKFTDEKGTEVNENDLIIAWDGANAGTIGFGLRGMIGSTLARLRIKEEKEYNTDFIGYLLRSQNKFLRSKTTGATIPHISKNALESINIPQLDYPKQYTAALVLKRTLTLIEQRKQSVALLDEFLKSTFLEMFGDPVKNEKEFQVKLLGDVLSIKHGFAFSSEFFTTDGGEYVLLTPGNFYEVGGYRDRGEKQKYYLGEFPKEYLMRKGELLVAMTEQAAGLLGSAIIVPHSNIFLHNQRLGLVQFDKKILSTHFLFYLFNFNSIRFLIHAKATGLKVRHTSPTRIQEISIGVPPIELQNKFSDIVTKAETLKEEYKKSLDELENLYGSLSQKAFKGELEFSKPVAVN